MGAGKAAGEVLRLGEELSHTLPGVGKEASAVGSVGDALRALQADALPAPAIVDSNFLGSTLRPGNYTFTVGNARPFGLIVPESMTESLNPKTGTTAVGYLADGVTPANDFTFTNMTRQLRVLGPDGLAEQTGTPFVSVFPNIKRGMVGGIAKVRAWDLGDPTFGLTRQTPGVNDINDYLSLVNRSVDEKLPTVATSAKAVDNQPQTAPNKFAFAFSEGAWVIDRWQVAEKPFSDLVLLHPTIGVRDLDLLRGDVPKTNVVIVMGQNDKMLPPGRRAGNHYEEGGRGLMTALMPEAAKSRPQLVEDFWRRANGSAFGNIVESNDVFDQTRYVGVDGHEVNVYFLKGRQAMHGFHGSPVVQPLFFRFTGQQLPANVFDAQKLILDYMPVNRNGRMSVSGRLTASATTGG